MRLVLILCLFMLAACDANRLDNVTTVDEYLGLCMDSKYHKVHTGPEPDLKVCAPWKDNACCSATEMNEEAFTWFSRLFTQCSTKNISKPCQEFFLNDFCAYGCSPNLGPWLVQDSKPMRNERFKGVPLCKSQCDKWFEACRNDTFCVDNWTTKLNWKTGECPVDSTCTMVGTMYSESAEVFCETVYDGSYKVVDDDNDCMRVLDEDTDVKRNGVVAKKRAEDLVGNDGVALRAMGTMLSVIVICRLMY